MLGLRLLEGFVHASDSLSARLKRSARPSHLELGRRGEEAAFFYLRRQGFVVVARDWRSGKVRGDLDLVAWEKDVLCFIEVKSRSTRFVATAESAVDTDKTQVLRRLARQYTQSMPVTPERVRFDILSVYFETRVNFELYRGAFSWQAAERRRY
jgi:putative endonuclease